MEDLAEDGHLLSPRFSRASEKAEMHRVGVRAASAFPGFCAKHEQEFQHYERAGVVDDLRAVVLQVFRTACRELRVKQRFGEEFASWKAGYEKRVGRELVMRVERLLGEEWLTKNDLRVEKLEVKDDWRAKAIHAQQEVIAREVEELSTRLVRPLQGAVEDLAGEVTVGRLMLKARLPMTLAGLAHIPGAAGAERNPVAIINVLPTVDGTQVLLVANQADEEQLHALLRYYSQTELLGLTLIETAMIHGSDHWFITPSAWECLPRNRQRALLRGLHDLRWHLGDPCPLSIFDSAREALVERADCDSADADTTFVSHLEAERKKLRPEEGDLAFYDEPDVEKEGSKFME